MAAVACAEVCLLSGESAVVSSDISSERVDRSARLLASCARCLASVSGSGDMTGVTVRSGRHGGNKVGPAFGPAVGDATMTSEARPRRR